MLLGMAGAAAALGTAAVAGCGSTISTSGPKSSGLNAGAALAGSADAGVLNVWGGVPAANGPQKLLDEFQAKYPKIKVSYTQFVNDPNGNVKLDTALQGGAKIDVLFTYSFDLMAQRAKSGQLLDLTDTVKADSSLTKLSRPSYTPVYDGRIYSLPTVAEINFVVLNKKIVQAAGLTIPDKWTTSEFRTFAQKLSKNGVYGSFNYPPVAIPTLGPDARYNADGTKANFTHPAWRKEVELGYAMAKEKSIFPMDQIISQQLSAYSQNAFLSGKAALWITAPFSLRFVNDVTNYPHDFVTTFAPLPTPDGVSDPYNTGLYGNLISIAKSSEYSAAAWTFVKYWLTDGAKALYVAGKVPALQTDSDDAVASALLGSNAAKLYDVDAFKKVAFDKTVKYGVPTKFKGAAEMSNAMTQQTQQLLLGQITPDQWVTNMQSQGDAAIAKDA
ncbi:MAG: ABC transporter substrate-binding protein [Propionibacteriaceae bacterium]